MGNGGVEVDHDYLKEVSFSHIDKGGNKCYNYECTLCNLTLTKRKRPSQVSCGCHKALTPKVDRTGEVLNGVTVLGYVGKSLWRVLYRCGCIKECRIGRAALSKTGDCKSCFSSKGTTLHSHAKRGGHTRTYNSWCNMRRRCYSPDNNRAGYYKEVGITVCSEWNASFGSFLSDMGGCPSGFSIERLDVTKGYSKGNCIWADDKTQANNKTNNILISNGEEIMSLKHWCKEEGVEYKKAHYRFKYKGEDIKSILGDKYYKVSSKLSGV